jgi:hypothetical protein
MATITPVNDDPGSEPSPGSAAAAPAAESLVTAPLGDTCAACAAPLAPDQRYCVECGERRGKARFTATPAATASREVTSLSGRKSRWGGFSASTTLIAGIATLLLAMGVGVLIGRSGNNSGSSRAASVQVIPGAAAAAPASTAAASATTPAAAAKTAKPTKAKTPSAGGVGTKVITTVKNLPPPTVTVGGACSGSGCQNGHFTGNFFGN